MVKSSDFKQLRVWQESMLLVHSIYRLTRTFPAEERFGLADQLRRAAVSIPSNIAEGQARDSEKDFSRFLSIARGSVAEVETQLLLCRMLELIPEATTESLTAKLHLIGAMIQSLKRYLDNPRPNATKTSAPNPYQQPKTKHRNNSNSNNPKRNN